MKQDEYRPLPGEFPGNAPEFAPPGPEFALRAPRPREARRKKHVPALAAAVLFLGVLIFPQVTAVQEPPEPTGEPPATFSPAPVPPQGEPLPSDPVGPPACQSVFFAFSDALRAKLLFTNPDRILSARAELWDSAGETQEQAWDIPRDEILRGEYVLPDMMGIFEMYLSHHESYDAADSFPVPELRVSMTCSDGETRTLRQSCTEELGWGARIKDGQVLLRTYESYEPVSIRLADTASAGESVMPEPGELLVRIEINGTPVDAPRCTISRDEEIWQGSDGEDITFYYANLSMPQPDGSGLVTVTVSQRLTGYDAVWTETVQLEY